VLVMAVPIPLRPCVESGVMADVFHVLSFMPVSAVALPIHFSPIGRRMGFDHDSVQRETSILLCA
jgi:hypothetical protein